MVGNQNSEDEITDNDPALWSMGRDLVLIKGLKNINKYTYTTVHIVTASESERN